MEKKRLIWTLAIGVIASIVGAVAYNLTVNSVRSLSPVFTVQVMPLSHGKHVSIDSKSLRETPNQDGIVFIYVTGIAKEYDGNLVVEIQPVDVPEWFKQGDVKPSNGTFIARIQLGSPEWPIRGDERYLIRVSAGKDLAMARMLVDR